VLRTEAEEHDAFLWAENARSVAVEVGQATISDDEGIFRRNHPGASRQTHRCSSIVATSAEGTYHRVCALSSVFQALRRVATRCPSRSSASAPIPVV
jgi:hypothetical protein